MAMVFTQPEYPWHIWICIVVHTYFKLFEIRDVSTQYNTVCKYGHTDQRNTPLTIFRSNSKFFGQFHRSNLMGTDPIATKFCTYQELVYTKFRFDRIGTIENTHYNDVIMDEMASQITSLTIVYSILYSGADRRKQKVPRHWPLYGEFTGDWWIPRTNGE